MTKRYKLNSEFMTGDKTVNLGSHRPGQPDPVTLTPDDPIVVGEEYGIYEPEILVEIPEDPKVEDKKDGLEALTKMEVEEEEDSEAEEEEMEDLESEEEESDARSVEEILNSGPEPADDPSPPEPDELEIEEKESPEELDVEDLGDMNRDELENIAVRMGIKEDIEGSGSGGYVTVSDFKKAIEDELGD